MLTRARVWGAPCAMACVPCCRRTTCANNNNNTRTRTRTALQVNRINTVFERMERAIDAAPAVHRTPAELRQELAALEAEQARLRRVSAALAAELAQRRATWRDIAATVPRLDTAAQPPAAPAPTPAPAPAAPP